jgi:hypothetical protein
VAASNVNPQIKSKKRNTTDLETDYPKLFVEWDFPKNTEAGYDFGQIERVDDKFWWQCGVHESHSWRASLRSRYGSSPRGCPFCTNKAVCATNSLATVYPGIAAEWHPTKNDLLSPDNVVFGSAKLVWWMCSKNNEHQWQDQIFKRTRNKKSCPDCAQEEKDARSLANLYPLIAAEWDEVKNGVPATKVAPFSHKPYWWRCLVDVSHVWEMNVAQRHNSGCPFCSTRKVNSYNNLLFVNPTLARKWHPTKNVDLVPSEILANSRIKYWWFCPEGADHEWEASPYARRAGDCPFCAEKTNSLRTHFPDIANEWLRTDNEQRNITPETVTYGSKVMVWWQCQRFPEHKWKATVNSRTAKESGCPHCAHHTSAPELRVFTEIKALFNSVEARRKIDGKEIDIYFPDLKLGIEYDGSYFHKFRKEKDSEKNLFFAERGIMIVRLRESPLIKISGDDIIVPQGDLLKSSINQLLRTISKFQPSILNTVISYCACAEFINDREYRRYLSYLPGPLPEESLAALNPELSSQWDMERNSPLTPELFAPFSQKEVHWRCLKFPDHRWQERIAVRSNNRGCPFCSGHRVSDLNRLTVLYPRIAQEWHHEKNREKKPKDFSKGSGEVIWWQCPKKAFHVYQMSIGQRTRGYGCSFCAGKKVHPLDSINHHFPEIAAEWDYETNAPNRKKDPKGPKEILPGSSRIVGWVCGQCGAKYKKATHQRTRYGRGCVCGKKAIVTMAS